MADAKKVKKVITLVLVLFILGAALCAVLPIYIHFHYPLNYRPEIEKNAQSNNISPSLLAAVVYEESRFNEQATSKVGASGLMQIMPETASFIAQKIGESTPQNIVDPATNIKYGSWYLKYLLDRSDGDESSALAAYNAGPTNVANWKSQGQEIQFEETANFVKRIEKTKEIYKKYYFHE